MFKTTGITKIVTFLLFMISLSLAQIFQYMNVSNSEAYSDNAVVRVDAQDNLHVFWIEENREIHYRCRINQTWSDVYSIYQSDSANAIPVITAQTINDSGFVFFGDKNGDSTYLVCCKVHNGTLVKTDTLKNYFGVLDRLRSAKNQNEIGLALKNIYSTDTSSIQKLYVIQFPQNVEWLLEDPAYSTAGFSLSYDKGDTLWYFSVDYETTVYSRYLAPNASHWSDWITAIDNENDCNLPLKDIDCKYNRFSNKFNMILISDNATCTDCIENNIIYTEGYGQNWSNCEYIERSGSVYMAQGSYDYPNIEVTSSGTRELFYKFDYSDANFDDEYSIRQAKRADAASSWSIAPILFFTAPDFELSSTAIDSKDSVRLTYSYTNDVYLASPDNPSLINKKKTKTFLPTFRLFPVYPNPFNLSTVIRYHLSTRSKVTIKIYDILGKAVTTLFNGDQAPGTHSLIWNAENLCGGIYLIKLTNNSGFTATQKVILLK